MGKIVRYITTDGSAFVIAGDTTDTVSYTHLDVYKRQILINALKFLLENIQKIQ